MNVKCPTCKKSVEYSTENAFRPFCCERCRLIDLGNWADGSYTIPVKPATQEGLPAYPVEESHNEDDEISEEMRH